MESRQHKKIHIAFVLPSLLPGGIEKHTLKLLRHFDRTRFSFSLVTLFDLPGRSDLYNDVPDDVTVYRLAFATGVDIPQWKHLYTIFKKEKPDVVVSSMFSANTIVRFLKPLCGYKVVTREHNIYSEKNIFQRFVDMVLAPLSNTIIAVSSSVADFFSNQAWVNRGKIKVVHNGVDIVAIDAYIREKGEDEALRVRHELGILDDEKIILNVARLKPQKNHKLLIDAFSLFVKTHPQYHLVIVGDGVERERLKTYVCENNVSKVHIVGYRSDVFAFYSASTLFTLTSRFEGFPNVGVEAMAFGLPMVSTSVPGVDEFLVNGENGFIVASDTQSVARGMSVVVDVISKNPSAYTQNCRETAGRFDIVKITKEYEKIIQSILQKNT